MIVASRITKAAHATSAFDGEGARRAGGRWNTAGHRMVYTSASAALAALEIVVNVRRSHLLVSYVLFTCEFPEAIVEQLAAEDLPAHWRSSPVPPETQSIGDAWLRSRRSAVLKVPSAVIETDSNFLLNPEHPDFGLIRVSKPQPFFFDARLSRS
jgi:RES domain-containing protein